MSNVVGVIDRVLAQVGKRGVGCVEQQPRASFMVLSGVFAFGFPVDWRSAKIRSTSNPLPKTRKCFSKQSP